MRIPQFLLIGLTLSSSTQGAPLFHTAILNTDIMYQTNRRFVTETCNLYGSAWAVSFTKVAFHPLPATQPDFDGSENSTLPAWRLTSVTCEETTYAATNEKYETVAESDRWTCQQLLDASHMASSLATRKVTARCLPFAAVSRTAKEDTENQISVHHVISELSATALVPFAWESGRRDLFQSPGRSRCEYREITGGRKFRIFVLSKSKGATRKAAEISVANGTASIDSLVCSVGDTRFEVDESMPLYFAAGNGRLEEMTCLEMERLVHLDAVCATTEDLRQRVRSIVMPSLNQRHAQRLCYVEVAGSSSWLTFRQTLLGEWRFDELHCEAFASQPAEAYRLQGVLTAKPELAEPLARIELKLNQARVDRSFDIFAHFLSTEHQAHQNGEDAGILDERLIPECMALKIENLSGVSFNRLCRRHRL
jgi:hypothetical protein